MDNNLNENNEVKEIKENDESNIVSGETEADDIAEQTDEVQNEIAPKDGKEAEENNTDNKKKPFDLNIIIAFLAADLLKDLAKKLFGLKGSNAQQDLIIIVVLYLIIYFLLIQIKKRREGKK